MTDQTRIPVNTGLPSPQPTLMDELKAATSKAHAALDGAPYFRALGARDLQIESYVGHLRALALIHGVLEETLAETSDTRIASLWSDDMRKVPLLQQDLRYFEPRYVADLKEAVEAAIDVDGDIRVRSIERPVSLLGYLYVLEGSTLGGQVLRPLFAAALGLDTGGLSYINSYGSAVRARWTAYKERMNALALDPAERAQVIEAAEDCFNRLGKVFVALYPFSAESKTFLVTSINPEAGRHAVPADPREIEACLKAHDRCWQRFPYFEFRYGERGRRFSRSDGAWQATLHQYEPAQILRQVQWLGRVLASRGMPTILLQAQLEILVEELSLAIPENKSRYEKLLLGSAELQAARRRHLSDEQIRDLAQDFDRAAGPEWSQRLPYTGALLACAVADELEGNDGAVTSLEPWMTDAGRFPDAWRAAVNATLIAAREHAAKSV